jgi:hypothetical protein
MNFDKIEVLHVLIEHASIKWVIDESNIKFWAMLSNLSKNIRDKFRFNKIRLTGLINAKSYGKASVKFRPQFMELKLFDRLYLEINDVNFASACMQFLEDKQIEIYLTEPDFKRRFKERGFILNPMIEFEDSIEAMRLHINRKYNLKRLPANVRTLDICKRYMDYRPIEKNIYNLSFASNLHVLIINNNKRITHLPPNLEFLKLNKFHRMPSEHFPKSLTILSFNKNCNCKTCRQNKKIVDIYSLTYLEALPEINKDDFPIRCGLLDNLILINKFADIARCKKFKYYHEPYFGVKFLHIETLPPDAKIAHLGLSTNFKGEQPLKNHLVTINQTCFANLAVLKLFLINFGFRLDLSETKLEVVAIVTATHGTFVCLPESTKRFYFYESLDPKLFSTDNVEVNSSVKKFSKIDLLAYGCNILHQNSKLIKWVENLNSHNISKIYYGAPDFNYAHSDFMGLIQAFPTDFYQYFVDF